MPARRYSMSITLPWPQDEHAEASYDRAIEAISAGAFLDEIVPVQVPKGRKGTVEVSGAPQWSQRTRGRSVLGAFMGRVTTTARHHHRQLPRLEERPSPVLPAGGSGRGAAPAQGQGQRRAARVPGQSAPENPVSQQPFSQLTFRHFHASRASLVFKCSPLHLGRCKCVFLAQETK